ncbi:hypothetical protein FRC11_005461, partial [Ceratobasidium sp. 423]
SHPWPSPYLPFTRYENALGILDDLAIEGVDVARLVLKWPRNAEEFQGGFGFVKRALWNNQTIAVKFLSDRRNGTVSSGRQEQVTMFWLTMLS